MGKIQAGGGPAKFATSGKDAVEVNDSHSFDYPILFPLTRPGVKSTVSIVPPSLFVVGFRGVCDFAGLDGSGEFLWFSWLIRFLVCTF